MIDNSNNKTKKKKHTRPKRIKSHPIIGLRFFDGGEYGLGFFTIKKLWVYKEYSTCAYAPDGSRWFSKAIMLVEDDYGMKYKMPFCPWMKSSCGNKMMSDYFNERPFF